MKGPDITGQRFERLTVLGMERNKTGGLQWAVQCDCGERRLAYANSLRTGRVKSCGCYSRELAKAAGDRTRTHGMRNSSTYHIWTGMIQRCHNPAAKDYPRYGAKGITVCDRWRTFENFLADMGVRPTGLSLDRIDGTKGYSADNCRWATYSEQVRNSSAVRMVTIGDRTLCVSDWLTETGVSSTAYQSRVARGWSRERALTTPPDNRYNWHLKKRST